MSTSFVNDVGIWRLDVTEKETLDKEYDDWKNSEKYQKLEKKQSEYRDKKEEILELRTEIFDKLNLDDKEDQDNIVELIHNVVFWREINMSEVKTTLELSFTPQMKRMLEEKMGDE